MKEYDIVLLNSAKIFGTGKREPMGLQYLSGALKSKGYKVLIIDQLLENLSHEDVLDHLSIINFKYLGVSFLSYSYSETKEFLLKFRRNFNDKKIIIGGHFVSFCIKDIIKDNLEFDYAIIGEGEKSLPYLLQKLNNKVHVENRIINSAEEKFKINNLDELVYPERPFGEFLMVNELPFSISSSRGCYFNCSFCSVNKYYEKYATEKWRSRSVQNVIDEIVMLNRKFGATKFDFIDDNFLGSSRKGYLRAIELSNKLQDLDIDFEFSIDLRLELISEELIEEWEKVGLKNVMIGVESINKFDQDLYNKRINIDLIKEKINILNKFNIKYKLGTILWNPYTTYESLQENFDLLKELNYLETNLLTKVNVYKGTQIYTSLKKMLMGNFYDYTWNFVYAEINELYNVLYKNIALAHFLMNKCKFSNKVEKNIYINNMIFVNNMIRTKKQNEHKKIIDKYQRYLLNILEVSNKDVKKIERN